MTTTSEIIGEKRRRIVASLNSGELKEIVTNFYKPDAYLSDYTNLQKGHDQIMATLKTFSGLQFEFTPTEIFRSIQRLHRRNKLVQIECSKRL